MLAANCWPCHGGRTEARRIHVPVSGMPCSALFYFQPILHHCTRLWKPPKAALAPAEIAPGVLKDASVPGSLLQMDTPSIPDEEDDIPPVVSAPSFGRKVID